MKANELMELIQKRANLVRGNYDLEIFKDCKTRDEIKRKVLDIHPYVSSKILIRIANDISLKKIQESIKI